MNLPLTGIMQNQTFLYPVRVYFSDTDAGGVVYHSRYLDFAEHARTELLRYLGGNQRDVMQSSNSVFVVRSITVDYVQPAFLDDYLVVHTTITKCAKVTIVFNQEMYRKEQLISKLVVKAGYISMDSGRPQPMPDEWCNTILPLTGKQ